MKLRIITIKCDADGEPLDEAVFRGDEVIARRVYCEHLDHMVPVDLSQAQEKGWYDLASQRYHEAIENEKANPYDV